MSKNKYLVDNTSLDDETIISRISKIETNYESEKKDRIKSDSLIKIDLSKEKTDRAEGDSILSNKISEVDTKITDTIKKINDEIVDRSESISKVKIDLSKEKTERVDSDLKLSLNISEETTLRKKEDLKLQQIITNLDNRLFELEKSKKNEDIVLTDDYIISLILKTDKKIFEEKFSEFYKKDYEIEKIILTLSPDIKKYYDQLLNDKKYKNILDKIYNSHIVRLNKVSDVEIKLIKTKFKSVFFSDILQYISIEKIPKDAKKIDPYLVIDDEGPLFNNQGYLKPAPDGVDAKYVWDNFSNSVGNPIFKTNFVDLEQGWILEHEDLPINSSSLIYGDNKHGRGTYLGNHGTAVVGQVSAIDNKKGIIGIASGVGTVKLSSHYRISITGSESSLNVSEAILSTIPKINKGDVLLLEVQRANSDGDWDLPVPTECNIIDFWTIKLATILGIIVVEAAGNGGNNLDNLSHFGFTNNTLNKSSLDYLDSGAIMVGACSDSVPHTRMGFSNFGSRIDCCSWGNWSVTTTGYGDAGGVDGGKSSYTNSFSGTSSASPIIVGVILLIQSYSKNYCGKTIDPDTMREILRNSLNGTPIYTSSSGTTIENLIGRQPNLKKILSNFNCPDVYIRDNISDIGISPVKGIISSSPDIIIRNNKVEDKDLFFGESSSKKFDYTLSHKVEFGQDNFIYIRNINKGNFPALINETDVYWSEVSTLPIPKYWNYIGTTSPNKIEADNKLHVSEPLVWKKEKIPNKGHYCFIAVTRNEKEKSRIIKEDIISKRFPLFYFDDFINFVKYNNNVAWRNFNVIDVIPNASISKFNLDFKINGVSKTEDIFKIAFEHNFNPENIKLVLPKNFISDNKDVFDILISENKIKNENEVYKYDLLEQKFNFDNINLGSEKIYNFSLEIIGKGEDLINKEIFISQKELDSNTNIGGITWKFIRDRYYDQAAAEKAAAEKAAAEKAAAEKAAAEKAAAEKAAAEKAESVKNLKESERKKYFTPNFEFEKNEIILNFQNISSKFNNLIITLIPLNTWLNDYKKIDNEMYEVLVDNNSSQIAKKKISIFNKFISDIKKENNKIVANYFKEYSINTIVKKEVDFSKSEVLKSLEIINNIVKVNIGDKFVPYFIFSNDEKDLDIQTFKNVTFLSFPETIIEIPEKNIICLPKEIIISIGKNSNNENIFIFNNPKTNTEISKTEFLGMGKGTYNFINNNTDHPIGFCKNNIKQLKINGSVNMGTSNINDCLVNHYLGKITVEVLDDFGSISYNCLNHGYMGGKDRIVYTDKCFSNDEVSKNFYDANFRSKYLEKINETIQTKAEIPYTFYAIFKNYKISKDDVIGIFQNEILIGKYKFEEDKDNGSTSVNIFPQNKESPILILLKTKNESVTKWYKIIFDENNSNYKNIPTFNIDLVESKEFLINNSGFKINFKN